MPNGWFEQSPELVAFLKSEAGQQRIAEWKKANPNLLPPIWMRCVWNEEEASKCKKM